MTSALTPSNRMIAYPYTKNMVSIMDIDMAAALRRCDALLEKHGGHHMAAGFTVRTENLPALKDRLRAIAGEKLAGVELRR